MPNPGETEERFRAYYQAALDKGAPVPGYIYTLDFDVFLNVQVFGAYQ